MKNNLLEMYRLNKRIVKLENAILEAKQVGTLYHVCTLDAYLKYIAPSDQLAASGKYYNWVYGGDDFVSFTRDKYFVVATKSVMASKVLVQLVIDGDKLSEHYKIGPYNDFAFGPDGEHVEDGQAAKYREKEECCKGPIKNISKYIKEIRLDVFDMDNSALSKIRRSKLADRPDVKYYHFIKNYQDRAFTAWLRNETDVRDGAVLSDVMPVFKEYVNREKFNELLFSYDIDDVQKAIKAKADLNAAYPSGYVLETYCDDDSNLDIIELCLSKGANPNIVMKSSQTPVMVAAEFNSPEIVKALINAGADVNASDSDGKTALIIASESNSKEAVKVLLEEGADINHADNNGETALSVAKSKQIASMLKKAGAAE